jgi:long-chain fatty acid transport protein
MFFALIQATLSNAYSSTFYFSDIGVKGYSRAGAFIAGVDDVTAQWYNPAAFTRVEKGMFGIQVSYVLHNVSFTRTAEEELSFETVNNDSKNTIIPHGGVAYRFGDLAAYVGFTSPYADFLEYPSDGPQRYSLIESSVLQTFTGGVLSYKVNDWISFGAGLSWNILEVNQSRKLTMYSSNAPDTTEDQNYDVMFSLSVRDNFGVAYNFGTLIEPPSKKWALGLMVQPPTNFSGNGTISADFTEHFLYNNGGIIEDATAADEDVNMKISMPLIIRSGFLVRPTETLEIEFSFVWENWSQLPNPLIVEDVNMEIKLSLSDEPEVILGPIEIPSGYQDSMSFRLGGEWKATDKFHVRSGILFEQGGIPPQFITVASLDRDKIGIGTGMSYVTSDSLSFDVGVFYSTFGSWTVTDSEIKRLAAVIDISDFSNPEVELIDEKVVGNGSYTSSIIFGGMSATYNF